MDSFSLMNNALINTIDDRAVQSTLSMPVRNSLKTMVKIDPFLTTTGSETLYGKRILFDIPRQYDNLSQLYLKCTVSTGASASTVESYFSTKIFKYIRIKTKKGTVLQTITPEYTQERLDELYFSPLYSQIAASVEPNVTFALGDPVVFVPLFLFFSDNISNFLKTRSLENLELECIVNDDAGSMGMSASITSGSYQLYCLFHDENSSSAINDLSFTKKQRLPDYLVGSYEIFQEDKILCLSGSTEQKLLLRCPHPSYVLHISLIASDSTRSQVETVQIDIQGKRFYDMDYRANYQMYGKQVAFLENGTTSIFFSKNKDRSVDSGLITFSEQMYPSYLTVTFSGLSQDHTLHVFEEHRTNFKVKDNGDILLSIDEVPGTLDTQNSLNNQNGNGNV